MNSPLQISSPDLRAALEKKILAWKTKPVQFISEVLQAEPVPWQGEVLQAIVDHDRLAIRSGHGVGKSTLLSWVILWWLGTHYPAKVACTAPTQHQLQDILWSELSHWFRRMPAPLRSQFNFMSDRLELRGTPDVSFAVARTARKEAPEAFQGFHSPNMLFVVDEASGIEDIIFEVGSGAMSTKGAKTIMMGNPTRGSGYFFHAFNANRARWWTKKVSSFDSSLVSEDYPTEVAQTFGEESNVYRVRVLGEFPLSEDDMVIPLHLIEAAIERDVEISEAYRPVWGLDVARFGDDRCALAKRRSNALLEPVKSWHSTDTMETVGIVVKDYVDAPEACKPSRILVDVIGIGAGVVDRLREQGLPVRGVNVSETPGSVGFARRRDELWWKAREWFQDRACKLPKDDALIAELSQVKYDVSSTGKLQVESKAEMKKRGLRSPDLGDAFILTFAGALELNPVRRKLDRYERAALKQRRGTWMGRL